MSVLQQTQSPGIAGCWRDWPEEEQSVGLKVHMTKILCIYTKQGALIIYFK